VRQALAELVHEGLLYRQHGKGTFVCEPRVQQTVSALTSFTQEIQRRGKRPGGMLLVSELVRGSEHIRTHLELTDTEQLIRLERLRTADRTPIAHEIDYLPYPRAAAIYERAREVAEGSLYSLMATEGLEPYIIEQKLTADRASRREAELLNIAPDEPGLRLSCTAFDATGAPITYSESFYVGSRYAFEVTLRSGK
jgi:GntR family transcriptional regulator